MKKTIFEKCLLAVAPLMILTGCFGNDDGVKALTLDTDATIAEGEALIDQIEIGMSEADVKSVLDSKKVDYSEDDGVISGTTMVNFISYDSSCEYVTYDGTTDSASYNLYFKDEATHKAAAKVLADHFSAKMNDDIDLDVLESSITETFYYPIEIFEIEGEEYIRYISFAEVEYYEAPADGYTELGYEITEEYIVASDWEKLATGELEQQAQ
ncbi:hypothetical protein [Butyrivibrio sp. VCD2006]|uniref:hypothetical protein n=1 Tax=Butyrivibrio sp. VCD2006 TaxID=1280664 RepID=UPI000479B6AA|nr:hypothetical protein [Butyrivibrio sp. VCD2006]